MLTRKNFKICEIKAGPDGTLTGILSTYGNRDFYGDICEPGCFDATVESKGPKFPLLFNHNDDEPIGSFNVVSTEQNLAVAGRFNLKVQRAAEIYELVKAGDVDGMSIGYVAKNWYYDADGTRHLTEIELYEGSITPFPANPLARAEAKKMERIGAAKKGIVKRLQAKKYTKEQIDEILDVLSKAFEEGLEPEEEPKSDDETEEEESKEAENTEEESKEEEPKENTEEPKKEPEEEKSILTPIERKNIREAVEALRKISEA